ncbi:hypothetical protein AK812_SmicGene24355 [Symbiodinium microadriaticum]|uniref:Protein kinase domain-containing protein n=1 Tax=Symbiodinium microadriaticum TaxID=2951 RepID=A0A1Q9DF13_SYMMI|nr:hypothetical protein AK812_SmicGene24355 [Symbiodinium microadriaticum]
MLVISVRRRFPPRFLRTRIAKVHAVGGVVQAIDLACKKSADLAKIAKIQSGSSDAMSMLRGQGCEVVDSVEADNVSRKHRGSDRASFALVHGECGEDSEAGKPQKLATATEIRRENNEVALPGPERFKIGEKVFYNSKTLRQRVVAIVKGITADGLYDLDVKSFAATDCSGATPLGFQMPPTAFSTPSGRYGEDTRAGGVSGQLLPPGGYDAEGYDFAGTWGDSVPCYFVIIDTDFLKSFRWGGAGWGSQRGKQAMSGFKGGLNLGIWLVSGGAELVLKQVRCARVASNVLTEAENFIRVVKEHPETFRPQISRITQDPAVAFPVFLGFFFNMDSGGADRRPVSDVIVMKKSRGERLCEYVATKFYASWLEGLCEPGAAALRSHGGYGNQQHGDFQPSNIYYDESTASVSFIDAGG